MLEETVVGEADEERRFAARGVAEEDLFLDLVVGCPAGWVSFWGCSLLLESMVYFFLGLDWRVSERAVSVSNSSTSRKEGKKASAVDTGVDAKPIRSALPLSNYSLAQMQPLWGVRVGWSLDRLDVPEMRSFRTPSSSGSDSKLEAGAGSESVDQSEWTYKVPARHSEVVVVGGGGCGRVGDQRFGSCSEGGENGTGSRSSQQRAQGTPTRKAPLSTKSLFSQERRNGYRPATGTEKEAASALC